MKVYVRLFVCHLTYIEETSVEVVNFVAKGSLAEPVKPFFPYAIGECS